MSAASRVLRLPRTDANLAEDDSPVVLVQVIKRRSLEFDVAATENSNVYHTTLSETQINAAKDKKFKESDQEWHELVLWMFSRVQPHAKVDLTGLELVASVKDGKEVTITIRRNLGEIQPRLGSFSIPVNNDHMIDLFSWGEVTVQARNVAESALSALENDKSSQQQTIDKLTLQLDEFVKEKKNHEDQMLEKFRQLLNTKKLKIRDQQRLLKSAKIDHSTAATGMKGLHALSDEEEKPAVSGRKRKATATQHRDQSKGQSVDDVPMRDAETDESDGLPDEQALATPDRSDIEDEETEDEGDAPAVEASAPQSKETQRKTQSPSAPSRPLPVQTRVSTQRPRVIDEEETDDEL